MTAQQPACSGEGRRRVGEYGTFVQPLKQLLEDGGAFLGRADLASYESETLKITREGQGVHEEEAAFLYALVRAIKPRFVLETGTCQGYSTNEIARAIAANGCGHVVTADISADTGAAVQQDLKQHVTFVRSLSPGSLPRILETKGEKVDIFFHDSSHSYLNTLSELVCVAPFLASNAIVACHDAKLDFLQGFGVGRALRAFATEIGVAYLVLDTTCGIGLLAWKDPPSAEHLSALVRRLRKELRSEIVEQRALAALRRIRRVLST